MPPLRIEKKFELDERKHHILLDWLYRQETLSKHYPLRRIYSVYFDTIDKKSLNDNLAGISNRSKFRLRWYSNNTKIDMKPKTIRAECKFKNNALGGKNIFELSEETSTRVVEAKFHLSSKLFDDLNDVINLPLYFCSSMPILTCCYNREYYIDTAGLRLTIDRGVSFADYNPINANPILWQRFPKTIVEVKFPDYLSTHASNLLRSLPLRTVRNSKYVLGSAILGECVYL